MNKVYVAINIEEREGYDREFFILGVFNNKEDAQKSLETCCEGDLDGYDDNEREKIERVEMTDGFTMTGCGTTFTYEIREHTLQ